MKNEKVSIGIVSDGTFLLDGGAVFGLVPKTLWERNMKPDRRNRVRLGLNCMLIRTLNANILVDTGIGSKEPEITKEFYGHSSSKLLTNLRKEDISAKDIDYVVLTHLHFEKCGGATKMDREGNVIPTFPKAKYVIQKDAWEEAFNPNEWAVPKYSNAVNHLKVLEERDQLNIIDGDTEIVPGVNAVVLDGPSIGHMIVTVKAGGERVVFLGDVIPTPNHLPLPFITAFDRSPEQTLYQKKELLEKCEKEGSLMVFSKGHDISAAYLERHKGKIDLKPVVV
jgi:glyoxylase-like metal-dependent hydrolase (beta-lactamase superfamily II)